MNILQYCDLLNVNLSVAYRTNRPTKKWVAKLEDRVEVIDKTTLMAVIGTGDTPDEAIADYAKCAENQTVVFDALSPACLTYDVPSQLIGGSGLNAGLGNALAEQRRAFAASLSNGGLCHTPLNVAGEIYHATKPD